ncbi:RICIN domain-containing protein [Streptomyces sp. NPDC052676]|uniref:RICIN domain-containing protein n=1 Tax=Streptomyces sp. NPDC052676 TaxID=3154953 RepID=UPI00341976D4
MTGALRTGGHAMFSTAQDALNQAPDKLGAAAARDYWNDTPLSKAFDRDTAVANQELSVLAARLDAWSKPLAGLTTPAGFTEADFHLPPGSPGDGKDDFYGQTGLTKWVSGRFWQDEGDFYKDPTARADEKTVKAVTDLGTPLYGTSPDPSLPTSEWSQAYEEHQAWQKLTNATSEPMGADDARLFLSSGGFPRTALEPGSLDFRIAVEDLKSRFAACAWRTPVHPSKVLGKEVATASTEWQQEIASQAAQRNQILDANEDATKALAAGAKALGELLGHSWTADRLARWQDYWSPGGVGWTGDAPTVIEVHAAEGKCLDVEGAKKDSGTPVQLYTCNGSAAQKWKVYGDDKGLHLQNVNSLKCMDVSNNDAANGTRIQIWPCNSSPAQTWEFNLRATTSLKNVGTGKCLDLHEYTNGHNAWLWACNGSGPQQFDVKPTGHDGTVPPKAEFDQAKAGIAATRKGAAHQLTSLKAQLGVAKKAATVSDSAEQAAYVIADTRGAPRGRGLLVGQQKAQVTKGAVAALEAMVKAGETAEAATRASGGDSQTIAQRALAQSAQVKAEFRKEAAEAAELQAKAAADAAKLHRDNAKTDKETAEAQLAVALKAESDAKAAAADAHAKRLAAEAEEKTAKAEKEKAAAKQAEAAQHRKNAESEASTAKNAKDKAEASEATAVGKKNAAIKARDHAKAMRDDAWDAEQKADAARAKADAKAAYADSLDAGDAADAARVAAHDADGHADDAEAAAAKARSEADAATKAAEEADAAATRAEAAAKRARADADAAQAAKLKADAAVKTATSAAADAIAASRHAASEARAAVKLADEAEQDAKTAKGHADGARKEATKAVAASAKAAGFAHVTSLTAVNAGKAALQVAKPASDAIELGSPFVTTDSAAGLVVLTGQASKPIAEQQKAVAEAHARNAQEEAAAAKAIAEQAQGDAKAAYQHAAGAAKHAADARGYADEALAHAADAATAASKATASLARTVEYDRRATEDAAAADRAAGRAEDHATAARDSADQAALDAAAARQAASEAEQDAKDARAAANRADVAATEAEEAARDADRYAREAQDFAERTEAAGNNSQITAGATTGVGNVFYVVDRLESIGEPEVISKDNCNPIIHIGDCKITAKIRFNMVLDLYMCTAEDLPATRYGCPAAATAYLGDHTVADQSTTVTKVISAVEFNEGIDPVDVLLGHWIKCAQKITPGGESGSWGGCGWAALDVATLFAGKALKVVADAVAALDASVRTGIGFADAWKGMRSAGLTDEAIAGIGARALQQMEKSCKATRAARAARSGYCPWLDLSGPGKWMPETESMSQADRAYEQLVTGGVPSGISYKVPADTPSGFVKFDGYQNGTLIDAKNIHYKDSWITNEGRLKFPTSETTTMVKQVKAAKGTPVVWYMSDEKTRKALELWALDNNVKGIKFVFRQGQA